MTFSRIKHGFLLVTTLENTYETAESSQGFNIQKLFVWIRILALLGTFKERRNVEQRMNAIVKDTPKHICPINFAIIFYI